MGSFRTDETEARYALERDAPGFGDTCVLCDDSRSIKEFTHWRVLENTYPYDRIAKLHHMILPKRHVTEEELTKEEREEYDTIKRDHIFTSYEFIMEPVPRRRSIPKHFHLHMINAKDSEIG